MVRIETADDADDEAAEAAADDDDADGDVDEVWPLKGEGKDGEDRGVASPEKHDWSFSDCYDDWGWLTMTTDKQNAWLNEKVMTVWLTMTMAMIMTMVMTITKDKHHWLHQEWWGPLQSRLQI